MINISFEVKDDVKIKIDVLISNESDDRTSLEMIVNVRKIEYDLRVIVNRDTLKHSFYEIYFETNFEKEVVKEWFENEVYRFVNLSKNTTIKQMSIYERVKIKIKSRKTQYYLINVENNDYITFKSIFFEMKKLNSVKLQRLDAKLNRQYEQLLTKFDQCRKKNEHSNIEEQLINVDIEQMSWLSQKRILKSEKENNDKNKNENEDINIVLQKTSLKRNLK
jgi:uncharacterized protein YecT (DUF1311 family)